MNIKELLPKKKEIDKNKVLPILVEYITELKNKNTSDKEIIQILLSRSYSKELIIEAFELNLKEVKKMKKEYEEELDEESEEDDLDEGEEMIEDEDDNEEEPIKEEPKVKEKIKKIKEVKPEVQENGPTLQEILLDSGPWPGGG